MIGTFLIFFFFSLPPLVEKIVSNFNKVGGGGERREKRLLRVCSRQIQKVRGGTIPAHGAALTHQKQLSQGRGGGGEEEKIIKSIKTTGPYKLLKIINPPFWSLLCFPLRHSGRVREKKGLLSSGSLSAKVHTEQRLDRPTASQGSASSVPRFQTRSWYILKYFNFPALSSAFVLPDLMCSGLFWLDAGYYPRESCFNLR